MRRQWILASAKKLFSLHGYQGTTIEMITRDAELSPAAFYYYFKNKVDIYRALTLDGTAILESMLAQALANAVPTSTAKLQALAGAYFEFFSTHREYYNVIAVLHLGQQAFFTDQNLVPLLEEKASALLQLLAGIIEAGIESGEFRPLDAWETAATLWGMLDGTLMMEIRGTTGYIGISIARLTDRLLDLILAGIKKPAA